MFRTTPVCLLALLLCLGAEARGAVLTVPGDYGTVQGALDAAIEGDEIVVAPGRYVENLQFKGPNVVLRSADPPSTPVVVATILDGNQAGTVVTFAGSEQPSCRLAGFTITNGRANAGGGIFGNNGLATLEYNWVTSNTALSAPPIEGNGGGLAVCRGAIRHNIISHNAADDSGGGLYQCDGPISDNLFDSNVARFGGALMFCDDQVVGNIFLGNTALVQGGAVYGCNALFEKNRFEKNTSSEGGSAFRNCAGVIRNNLIYANTVLNLTGGALYGCNGPIVNNTIYGNRGRFSGGGLNNCKGIIQNCIIWGNTARDNPQLFDCSAPITCDIQDWTGGGTGNLAANPQVINAGAGDLHLNPYSICIDAGSTVPGLTDDFDGNPRPFDAMTDNANGSDYDIGAYEFFGAVVGANGLYLH